MLPGSVMVLFDWLKQVHKYYRTSSTVSLREDFGTSKTVSTLLQAKFSRIYYYICGLELLGERLICLNLHEVFFIKILTFTNEILENMLLHLLEFI